MLDQHIDGRGQLAFASDFLMLVNVCKSRDMGCCTIGNGKYAGLMELTYCQLCA